MRNLRYQYDRLAKPIIADLNLSIAAGESVAIVGPSGAGKTTLMKLMCGLLSPDEGAVLVDGMDISNIGVNNYRQCIACVLQDDKLLAGSIAENISGFDTEMDLKRIEACARRCNMHDDIQNMPMGYETLIGELGKPFWRTETAFIDSPRTLSSPQHSVYGRSDQPPGSR